MEVDAKQRRNAARELTSIVCAGCDGPKCRGAAYCRKCTKVMGEHGFPLMGPVLFAENYMKRLAFILSPKGQRLRQ